MILAGAAVGGGVLGGGGGGMEGGPTKSTTGVFIGEGLTPIPSRLAERIWRWEFVEMSELLPEMLVDHKAGELSDKQSTRARGRRRAQDITVWLQCYAVFVGVVVKSVPEAIPSLMAYMTSILRASQEFEGSAWAAYDAAYRRQRPRALETGERSTLRCTQCASQGKRDARKGVRCV